MNKWLKLAVGTIVLLVILAFVALHKIAPYAIISPFRVDKTASPADYGLVSESLSIYGADSVLLKGYWVKSDLDTAKGIIISLHGIGSCKEHGLPLAKNLAAQGIETIVFDGRGHGESGGQYNTYGFYEKQDVFSIVDYVKARNPDVKVGVWGNSLGGAIALQALAIDPRLEFGLIESTFTDMRQIVHDYAKRLMWGIGIKPASNYALWRAGKIANFDPNEVKPIVAVQSIEQPVLIAHGDADENISVEYGKQLFDNLKSVDKEWVVVAGGGHAGLFRTGGEAYAEKLWNFIARNLAD
ncbi:MAG: alpha/beta fold hydrolase [Bacteroidota bacterium]